MSATAPLDLGKYIEAEQIKKRELDDAQAAYDKCISDRDSYVKQHTKATLEQDKNKKEELIKLMTKVNITENALKHATARYIMARDKAADVKGAYEQARRNSGRDTGAGVSPKDMSPVGPDRALPDLVVSGTGTMAPSAQSSQSPPRGCFDCFRGKSKKRDTSPSKSATAGGRKSRIRKLKTKRTYKKRRTSRK